MRSIMRGFTLVELMIVVVVISILAAVAIPSYRNYVMRSQRADATVLLLRIQAAEEKFFLQNNAYSNVLLAAPPNGLGLPTVTDSGSYAITLQWGAAGAGVSYLATATAAAGQVDDTKCQTFTIDQNGTRRAADSGSADQTQECWRRSGSAPIAPAVASPAPGGLPAVQSTLKLATWKVEWLCALRHSRS